MKQERFQQIDALGLTESEACEFFKKKKAQELLAKYPKFPVNVLYASGKITQDILPDDNPLAMELDGHQFVLSFDKLYEMGAYYLDGLDFNFGGRDYKIYLPTIEESNLLTVYNDQIQICLLILKIVFDREEDFSIHKKIWAWDECGKQICCFPGGLSAGCNDYGEHIALFVLKKQ